MALPRASAPRYKLTIPSTKKDVFFRPFLVKEEKALMIAQQSEDPEVMLETLKGVVKDCILDDVDVDKLALFDIEYIFAQLRARSVGEIVELILRCDTCDDEKAKVTYNVDLSKIKVDVPKDHTNNIPLFEDVGVIMKYPSMQVLKKMESMNITDFESVFEIICMCIDSVYNSEEVFPASEQSKEELSEFVNNLTQDQFKKLQHFFETMPKLEEKVQYRCPVCSKEHEKYIRGLESFF